MNNPDNSTLKVLAEITAKNAGRNHKIMTPSSILKPANIAATIKVEQTQKEEQSPALKKRSKKETFKEPNISRRVGRNGQATYMVQIRRRVDGKQHSLNRTFRHLPNAKNWRNTKLLEIEVSGFPIQIVTKTTIADVIDDRLARGKEVGRSATQCLKYVRNSEFGQTKVSTLSQQQL